MSPLDLDGVIKPPISSSNGSGLEFRGGGVDTRHAFTDEFSLSELREPDQRGVARGKTHWSPKASIFSRSSPTTSAGSFSISLPLNQMNETLGLVASESFVFRSAFTFGQSGNAFCVILKKTLDLPRGKRKRKTLKPNPTCPLSLSLPFLSCHRSVSPPPFLSRHLSLSRFDAQERLRRSARPR